MAALPNPETITSRLPRPVTPPRSRIFSVDAVRGAVMILMAIDHTRDFINSAAMQFLPTDLSKTTAALFFTRWITHFCAPVFAFTAGIGAFFWAQRKTKAELSRFLVTRGLWLMLLEVTVLRFILFLDIRFTHATFLLTVLWMLGLSMVLLAALVHLPPRLLAGLSLAVIAAHNLFDHVQAAQFGRAAWVWDVLHQQGAFAVGGNTVVVAYPLVPWFAVMACGYCLGPVFLWDEARRRRFLLRLGAALSAGFIALRLLNVYGDPFRWSVAPAGRSSTLFTLLSFLNTTKYPPSLDFLLMTLGPALLAMAWLERARLSSASPLIVFGRVPFLYFMVHLAVIHAIAIAMNFVRYGNTRFLLTPAPSMGGSPQMFPSDYGFPLWLVYAVWIVVLVMLYPLCRRYAQLKQQRRAWWLSYL
jgi:uncharacterized membrane protein